MQITNTNLLSIDEIFGVGLDNFDWWIIQCVDLTKVILG